VRTFGLVSVLVALIVAGITPAASSAATHSCPNVRGAEVIGARNMSCTSARKLARVWVSQARQDGRYDRDLFGFRCRNRPSAAEGDTIVCRKGSRRATWYVNAFWAA